MIENLAKRYKLDLNRMLVWGSVAVVTTFTAGFLFGKNNMMIAYVIILGYSIFERQNLRVKTGVKFIRLILRDVVIVCVAFIASRNLWWGIPINFVALFSIIYLLVSPYDQISYKTFMMLYVFCQYNAITLEELPIRLLMVVFTLFIIGTVSFMKQLRRRALLDDVIGKAWAIINEELKAVLEGRSYEEASHECIHYMNELAYSIYLTGYRRYLTTYIGKIQFHFYLNISYFNLLISQIEREYKRGRLTKANLQALIGVTESIDSYFKRQIKRNELIDILNEFISEHEVACGFEEEVFDMIYAVRKNFVELQELDYKEKNKIYSEWERVKGYNIQGHLKDHFKPKSMSFNFAVRMAIILTISLLVAELLGFYKVIWAVIPIMSITQPYYEDTKKRQKDRVKSNLLACVLVGVIVNIVSVEWINIALLIIGFYAIYAVKDYYRMSFALTIVSMCLSSFSTGINTLILYRVIYVLIGAAVVELSARLVPYKLEDGIRELVKEIDKFNDILERESIASLEGKSNLAIVRNVIIYSALLCQKLYLKNEQYKSEKIATLINVNTEFSIRLGHKLLSQE